MSLPLAVALLCAPVDGPGQSATAPSAQTAPTETAPAPQDMDEPVILEEVEVIGRRGAALTPPEIELDGPEIDALGAWDIGEVLDRLQEVVGERNQPLVLINGRLTPNPGVFAGFPPDALERAEILPPNAGALYGAEPGQRVVNLVLQRRFSSHDGRLVGARPTQGGASSLQGDLRRSDIADRNTHQLGIGLSRETALRVGERADYLTGAAPVTDRVTIRPETEALSATANMTRALGEWSGVFSLNGQIHQADSVVQRDAAAVVSRSSGESVSAAAGLSGEAGGWAVQANLNARALRSREEGLEGRESETRSLGLTGGLRRTVADLPAGPLIANLNLNLLSSLSLAQREGVDTRRSFTSGDLRAGLAVPLVRRGEGFAGRVLGDLDASVGAGLRRGDGGEGDALTMGLSWSPRSRIRLSADWARARESISDVQRFEPTYYGAPLVIFDFETGEAVEILPVRGGNPDLRPPETEQLNATMSFGPIAPWALSGNLTYQRLEARDGIGGLPALTREIEDLFPERVLRGEDGRIISIDYRPLNLGFTRAESLTSGLNFGLPRPAGASARDATVLRVSLSHSYQLRNEVVLLPGLATLDRLQGDGGGVSRHSARLLLDARRGRWGGNVSARWQDGARIRRVSGQDGGDDLMTAPFTTVDLKLSFQMVSLPTRGEGEGAASVRRNGAGLQLTLEVDNLFDERRDARLGDGRAAPGYGRDARDPFGRTLRLTLQRRF